MLSWNQFFANYLLREGYDDDFAARQLGVPRLTVQRLRRGDVKPRPEVAQRVSKWSQGEVPESVASSQLGIFGVTHRGFSMGVGDRRDNCKQYEECLWEFSERTDGNGHCPDGCRWFEALPREYHVAAATLRRTA